MGGLAQSCAVCSSASTLKLPLERRCYSCDLNSNIGEWAAAEAAAVAVRWYPAITRCKESEATMATWKNCSWIWPNARFRKRKLLLYCERRWSSGIWANSGHTCTSGFSLVGCPVLLILVLCTYALSSEAGDVCL